MPFRIALYETSDRSAAIAYDRPSTFLATLGRNELQSFGETLDTKVEAVIVAVTKTN